MRLFLASSYFGSHIDYLNDMIGDNRKVLVIFNARDYRSEQDKTERYRSIEMKMFADSDFDALELDLREYFGRQKELENYIKSINPGLIWMTGGSVFLLRKALELSGLDEILKQDLSNDKYILGGYSAASMVVSPDISHCDVSFDRLKSNYVREVYKSNANFTGVGLINEYICPHSDTPDHHESNTKRKKLLEQKDITPISLNDSSVYIINGDTKIILK